MKKLPFVFCLACVLFLGRDADALASRLPTASNTEGGHMANTYDWKTVERLIDEEKFEQAAAEVAKIRDAAQAASDAQEWTRALVKETQLRLALHGFETAVRSLRETPWPEDPRSHAILNLYYANGLLTYLEAYSWEISRREKVESTGAVDLTLWTREEIFAEAIRAFAASWAQREAMGTEPVSAWQDYLVPNSYPTEVRGTLRDAVSYLFVELLAHTANWRPEQTNEVFAFDLEALIRADVGANEVDLADMGVHPLVKIGAILADLEAWHARGERLEAALEARLERLRRLWDSYTQDEDRRAIVADLRARLPGVRDLPWWAEGMAQLATFVRNLDAPNSLVEAHDIALEGYRGYPGSVGGQHCLFIAKDIELPDYALACMTTDAPGARSIEVRHKNLPRLFFRAYRLDLESWIRNSRDYRLLPWGDEIRDLVQGKREALQEVRWQVELPPTPDYRTHRTFVTPPLEGSGLWVIASSAREDFFFDDNRLFSVPLILSDLVILSRTDEDGGVEGRVVSGRTGEPLAGVEVTLWERNWREGHRPLASATTDAEGLVRFTKPRHEVGWSLFLMARKGADLALDQGDIWFHERAEPSEAIGVFVYTDRSVYRPEQRVLWKVLVYKGRHDLGRFAVSAGTSVGVSLVDPNGQTVEQTTVTTNSFGTASGEFTIPSGRPLGAWSIQTSPSGSQSIRVEEFKRPTFEATFRDPTEPLRLNRPATLVGEARYYFGLPVVNGTVRWRVTREPIYAWWWGWWGESPPAADVQTVAVGTCPLSPDGTFTVTFTPKADERLAASGKGTTYRFSVSADVTDEGGETRSATRSFRLGFVAVEASITLTTGFVVEGEPAELTVSRTNLDGVGRPGLGTWRLCRLKEPPRPLLPAEEPVLTGDTPAQPHAYRTAGDSLRPRWDRTYSPARTLRMWEEGPARSHGTLTHDENGTASLVLGELERGAYRLHYETKDEFGATCEASFEFIVAAKDVRLPLPLLVLVEKGSVPVGGTARVLVSSGIPGQKLFLDLYKGGALAERRILTAGEDPTLLEIPVTEGDRGGFGLTVGTIADHQVMQFSQSVFVPWDNKRLAIRFSTFRDTLRPGARETWRVTISGSGETPVEANAAEVLAYMYDRSLDVFARHSPPNPLSLYPARTSTPAVRASLGSASGQAFVYAFFAPPPQAPVLYGDRLVEYGSYGIGGPGRRGIRRFKGGAEPPPPRVMSARDVVMAAELGSAAEETLPEAEPPMDKSLAEEKEEVPATEAPSEGLRTQFAETAFWEPHLVTESDGSAGIEFTVPDAVTAWNVWVHALTRDLRAGQLTLQATTIKELTVRPYVPRFLREGDEAVLKVVVNNASDAPLEGEVSLDIVDVATNESVLAEFGLTPQRARAPFRVMPGGGANVSFPVVAPKRVGTVAFKAVGKSNDLSDGELRPLPILPGRMHLAQSRFVTLRDKDRKVMTFEDLARGDDPTLVHDQLVITVDAQLFFTVLQALPYLVNFPYECTEQTLNRFLSTGIVSSLYDRYPAIRRMAEEFSSRQTRLETFDEADPNRKMLLEETPWLQEARGGADAGHELVNVLDARIARAERDRALAKLRKAQTSLGAFPWWPGGPPSPYMTLYLMHGFAKALEFGVEVPKDMVQRGWSYLARYFKDELRAMMAKDCCWEFLTVLNYVASCYPDPSWTGDMLSPQEREEILAFSFRHWKRHSPYLKGCLALTLRRMGRDEDARLVWDSVMDSAKETEDQGTFWAPEDRSWLWYNDTIETHAWALRTLTELSPTDPRRHGIVQWLLLNKKLNQWKSTKATAEVIYSLVHYLKAEGALAIREDATVTVGDRTVTFSFEPDRYTGKKNQLVIGVDDVGPHTATVVVEKEAKGFAFASATWHFSTERLPEADRGDFFQVSRRYFLRESTGSGFVLKPLVEGARIKVGDQVEVQISLRAKHEAEYVHLRDPRPSGLEPENPISRFKWDLGIGWYEEVRDSGTNFFFESLPHGEYTLKYRLRANMAGTFRVAPATVQSMYAPEFNAYSSAAVLTVVPAE